MFCYFIDIRAVSYYENGVYSKHIKWKQNLSCSVISHQVLTHTLRGPSDPGSLT